MTDKKAPAPRAGRRVVRKRLNRWNARRKQLFLAVLAETANVRHACLKAKMSIASAYDLKSRNATFAEDWRKALDVGYSEVELMLLRHAIEGSERTETVVIGEERKLKYEKTVRSFPLSVAMRLFMSHHEEVAAFRKSEAGQAGATSAADRAHAYLEDLRARLLGEPARQEEDGARPGAETLREA